MKRAVSRGVMFTVCLAVGDELGKDGMSRGRGRRSHKGEGDGDLHRVLDDLHLKMLQNRISEPTLAKWHILGWTECPRFTTSILIATQLERPWCGNQAAHHSFRSSHGQRPHEHHDVYSLGVFQPLTSIRTPKGRSKDFRLPRVVVWSPVWQAADKVLHVRGIAAEHGSRKILACRAQTG
jgi:hypothetical protein